MEDLTTGEELFNQQRSSLDSGATDSLTLEHIFTSTGDHNMRLTIDADSDVEEINDESNGVNNNIEEMTITVSGSWSKACCFGFKWK